MVVQARTLEFYGQYGFASEVIEQGVIAETAHVREGGSESVVEKFSPSVLRKWALVSARIRLPSLMRRTITNGS